MPTCPTSARTWSFCIVSLLQIRTAHQKLPKAVGFNILGAEANISILEKCLSYRRSIESLDRSASADVTDVATYGEADLSAIETMSKSCTDKYPLGKCYSMPQGNKYTCAGKIHASRICTKRHGAVRDVRSLHGEHAHTSHVRPAYHIDNEHKLHNHKKLITSLTASK